MISVSSPVDTSIPDPQAPCPARVVTPALPPDDLRIPFAEDETIVFASSSGHCNLDCSYCVVQPVAKHQPSLTYEDLRFVLDSLGGRVFFIFSGSGDFFAGYRQRERLLARLLEHDNVRVALDINGVSVHCVDELSATQLGRIAHVNLTFHYKQLVAHRALQVWLDNALSLLCKLDGPDFHLNMVLSPAEHDLWEEALTWYAANVAAPTGKRLVLINDVNRPFDEIHEASLQRVHSRFAEVIRSVRRGNFEALFDTFDRASCPAGQAYLRLRNDGRIDACPNVAQLQSIGNAKLRTLRLRSDPFECRDVRHCDCYHIASAGRMVFVRDEPPQP